MCRQLSNECQKLLFSATYDAPVMKFAEKLISNATVIRLKKEEQNLVNIKQMYIECASPEEKYRAITNIYSAISIGGAMIFCAVSTV
jgi:ATP-dependent RNA helicase DDX19/DBP5